MPPRGHATGDCARVKGPPCGEAGGLRHRARIGAHPVCSPTPATTLGADARRQLLRPRERAPPSEYIKAIQSLTYYRKGCVIIDAAVRIGRHAICAVLPREPLAPHRTSPPRPPLSIRPKRVCHTFIPPRFASIHLLRTCLTRSRRKASGRPSASRGRAPPC